MLYAYYRFAGAAALAAALAELSEEQRADVTDLGVLVDDAGAPLPGHHVTAAWRDGIEPPAFAAAARPATEAPVWFADVPRVPPPPAPPPAFIAKTTIYRRATDQELAMLDAAVAQAPLRQRLMWHDAAEGRVAIADIAPLFVAAVGQARAAELLDPFVSPT